MDRKDSGGGSWPDLAAQIRGSGWIPAQVVRSGAGGGAPLKSRVARVRQLVLQAETSSGRVDEALLLSAARVGDAAAQGEDVSHDSSRKSPHRPKGSPNRERSRPPNTGSRYATLRTLASE